MKAIRAHVLEIGREISEMLRKTRFAGAEQGSGDPGANASTPDCDILIWDLRKALPDARGFFQRLAQTNPNAATLLLSDGNWDVLFQALAAGGHNFIPRPGAAADLDAAIAQTMEGRSNISREIAIKITVWFRQCGPPLHEPGALSFLEQDILDHFGKGFLPGEVAGSLGLSLEALQTRLRQVYAKLQACPRRPGRGV